MPTDSGEPFNNVSRHEYAFLIMSAVMVVAALWGWRFGKPRTAEEIRQSVGLAWWVALALALILTLVLSRC